MPSLREKDYFSFCVKEMTISATEITDWKNILPEICLTNWERREHVCGNWWAMLRHKKIECWRNLLTAEVFREHLTTKTCNPLSIFRNTSGVQKKFYMTWNNYNIWDWHYKRLVRLVDPIMTTNAQSIESLRIKTKRRNKKEWGTSQKLIDSYFFEYLWQQRKTSWSSPL